MKYKKVKDIIVFIFISIKLKYNIKYLKLNLYKGDLAFFKIYYKYIIPRVINRKLF